MNTAIGSVVYSQGLEYIGDFLESLKNQSVQDFSIILLNDNIEENVFEKNYSTYITYFGSRIQVVPTQEINPQPYELRVELFEIVKKFDIDLLILCDCDDKCARNRVEETQKAYDENLFFLYNELRGFDGKRIMPAMPVITNTIMQLQECNYLGLSNTALIMNRISGSFIQSLKEGKTPIFDWYLFSRIILEGGAGKKIENAITYYRIYQNNLAGIPQNTIKELERELEIKKRHYELLKKYDSNYEELIRKYSNLDLNRYVNPEKVYSFWWGQLKCEDT